MHRKIIKQSLAFAAADIVAIIITLSLFMSQVDPILADIAVVRTHLEAYESSIGSVPFNESNPESLYALTNALSDTSALEAAERAVLLRIFSLLALSAIVFAVLSSLAYLPTVKKSWWKLCISFLGLNALFLLAVYAVFEGLSAAVAQGITGALGGVLLVLLFIVGCIVLQGLYPYVAERFVRKVPLWKFVKLHLITTVASVILCIGAIFIAKYGSDYFMYTATAWSVVVFVLSCVLALLMIVAAPAIEKALLRQ